MDDSYEVLVLHGPNLNLLGTRERNIYGDITLEKINNELKNLGDTHNIKVKCFQSNSESELVSKTQDIVKDNCKFLIINPASLTHSSISLRDAILGVEVPFIEVHIGNVYSREKFRHKSFFSDIAIGVITGLGSQSYILALNYAIDYVHSNKNKE